ncbi:hypothetical protein CEXT_779461 [Caerostris extrusa]|uniref:Uncharacterized protein n=1 Tax=Caerostris extrusa TaxID=172846 RepID=A0AAV4XXJ7_CAEEX|nr:hypothetical protein CEXT_779461 [Caerostris extrusa]
MTSIEKKEVTKTVDSLLESVMKLRRNEMPNPYVNSKTGKKGLMRKKKWLYTNPTPQNKTLQKCVQVTNQHLERHSFLSLTAGQIGYPPKRQEFSNTKADTVIQNQRKDSERWSQRDKRKSLEDKEMTFEKELST